MPHFATGASCVFLPCPVARRARSAGMMIAVLAWLITSPLKSGGSLGEAGPVRAGHRRDGENRHGRRRGLPESGHGQ
jgi:hypothetical protein